MNHRDKLGIVHESLPDSGPDQGRTRCGQPWVTFWSDLHREETQDEVDCMACIQRRVHAENLRSRVRDAVNRWRLDPIHIVLEPVSLDITEDDAVAVVTVHDEIVVP